jgi:hypothetical protein
LRLRTEHFEATVASGSVTLPNVLLWRPVAINPVADLLAKQSRSKLKAMLAGLDTAEASIKAQRLLILDALDSKGQPADGSQSGNGRGHTGTSDVLRQIMRESGGRVLMPKTIISTARERGVTSSDAAIRVALRRLHKVDRFLDRGPGGSGWRLASSNGPTGESFSEAPSSGLGEHGRQSSRTDDPGLGASSSGFDAQTRTSQGTS